MEPASSAADGAPASYSPAASLLFSSGSASAPLPPNATSKISQSHPSIAPSLTPPSTSTSA
ncbi:hypothetical protein LINPERPRIM_LOCUS5464 [Linum perenne]